MNDTYIIIGRDANTGQLLLSGVGKSGTYGNNVPQDISEQHCRLDFNKESIRLKNLDINNFTYVNGQAVESKTITRKDKIELGGSRFPLTWEAIDAIVPPEADIRPLQEVWEEYERQTPLRHDAGFSDGLLDRSVQRFWHAVNSVRGGRLRRIPGQIGRARQRNGR